MIARLMDYRCMLGSGWLYLQAALLDKRVQSFAEGEVNNNK